MPCTEYEDRIVEYAQLSAARRAEVDAHLARCAGCRELAGLVGDLDAALARELRAPELAASFNERLWRRIEADAARMAATDPAARKLALEAEYATIRNRLRQQMWSFVGILNAVAGASLAGLAGWVLASQLPRLGGWLPTAGVDTPSAQFALTSCAALLFVAGGIGFAFRGRVRRLLAAAL